MWQDYTTVDPKQLHKSHINVWRQAQSTDTASQTSGDKMGDKTGDKPSRRTQHPSQGGHTKKEFRNPKVNCLGKNEISCQVFQKFNNLLLKYSSKIGSVTMLQPGMFMPCFLATWETRIHHQSSSESPWGFPPSPSANQLHPKRPLDVFDHPSEKGWIKVQII